MSDFTQLLLQWTSGDKNALDRLTPSLYDELRRLADSHLRRQKPGHTLQPTALVHEAYMKLADQTRLEWKNRAHFFGIAAHVMRQILVDHARRTKAAKRGGDGPKLSLDDVQVGSPQRDADVEALDEALQALAGMDERKSKVIELRYFGGLTSEEIGEVLGISVATVGRELRVAQMWLRRSMTGEGGGGTDTAAAV